MSKIKLSDHFTVGRLFRFVLPSVAMMVFISIYGVVDGFFVSNFAGKTSFASINLIMPFVMILGGVGFMVGTGGTALVSQKLGEGDEKTAKRYFTMMIMLTVILGAVLTTFGLIFTENVAVFFGATPEMLGDCVLYGRIVISFTTAFMLQNVFQSFFIAAEKPKLGLISTIMAGCTNIILDAVFVGLMGFGVAGAAFATGISECVGGIFPLIYFLRPNSSILRLTKTRLEIKPLLRACANGSSELMSSISSSVVSIIYNFQLMKYIGENGVSTFGVMMYVQFIFIAIFVGYSIGCAPVIGFNYGAQNRYELNNMLKKSLCFAAIAGVTLVALSAVLASPLAKLFVGYDAELYEQTRHAFRIFSLCFLLAGFNIFTSSFFTALGNGAISAAVSFMRTLIFQVSSILILPLIFGVDGIWMANVVAEFFAFLLSLMFLIIKRKKYGYWQKNVALPVEPESEMTNKNAD